MKIIQAFMGVVFSFLFFGCDGAIVLKVYTYQNNSVTGLYESDTTLDGTAVPNVKLNVRVADKFGYERTTDTAGKFLGDFVIPPFVMERKFSGFIIATKTGYKADTLFFDHSSVDKRVAIIDMKPIK